MVFNSLQNYVKPAYEIHDEGNNLGGKLIYNQNKKRALRLFGRKNI